MDAKALKKHGEHLFSKKEGLDSLWQSLALNFYVERASFTATRAVGEEFAAHLMSGYPVMARRDLGNSLGSMLRKDRWFKMGVREKEIEEQGGEGKRWLEWASDRQYKLMYDRKTGFVRATKEGDMDFVTFGQCALSVEVLDYSQLLFRCWHLRDVAFSQGLDGRIDTVHLKHKMLVKDVCHRFKNCHAEVATRKMMGKEYEEVNLRWCVYPHEDGGFWSVHLDADHDHEMEKIRVKTNPFVIPRWQTVSESQYAYSPAAVVAIPDARLLQAMTLTLLEAGEMSVRPPMLAVQEAIRSDIQLVPGGITWTDSQYDERLGEVLRPLSQDRGGFPAAFRIDEMVRTAIHESFFLNKLNLPINNDMTAYEVQQRIQEYIRNTLPLFEPMEHEYNAAVCETTFETLMQHRAFGDYIPEDLQGQEIEFRFESPLQSAIEREKAEQFKASIGLLLEAAQVDPNVIQVMDFPIAARDAITGLGSPAKWVRSEKVVRELVQMARQAQQQQAAIAQAAELQ